MCWVSITLPWRKGEAHTPAIFPQSLLFYVLTVAFENVYLLSKNYRFDTNDSNPPAGTARRLPVLRRNFCHGQKTVQNLMKCCCCGCV